VHHCKNWSYLGDAYFRDISSEDSNEKLYTIQPPICVHCVAKMDSVPSGKYLSALAALTSQ